jgi:AraC family transcriptional regulator
MFSSAIAMHATHAMPQPLLPRAAGLQVDLHATRRGVVALAATTDHRIRIQADPASGICEGKHFAYARGDVDLLPAGSAAQWEEDGDSAAMILRFPPSLLQRTAEELGLDGARVGLTPRHQLRDPQIEHIAWALHADSEAGHPVGPIYAESLGLALAAHLITRHRMPQPPVHGLSKSQLRRVTDYVEAHLDQDLSLARLAQVAGISASHLKTLFKRSVGLPVHAYVVTRRVERARALLLQRELPASQVALDAGFAHQSHMVRCMRRVLGAASASLLRRTGKDLR